MIGTAEWISEATKGLIILGVCLLWAYGLPLVFGG